MSLLHVTSEVLASHNFDFIIDSQTLQMHSIKFIRHFIVASDLTRKVEDMREKNEKQSEENQVLNDYISNTTSHLSRMSNLNSSGTSRPTASSLPLGSSVRLNEHIGELSRFCYARKRLPNVEDGL